MTPFKRITIQVIILFILFIGMLAVLGRESLADENNPAHLNFFQAVVKGWNTLLSPQINNPQPGPEDEWSIQTGQCAYQWASQPLPDVSSSLSDIFSEAGLRDASIIAEAYGENCIDPQTGQIIRFITLQTDIRIRIADNQIWTEEDMGNMLAQIITVISAIPPQDLPGTQSGMIEVVFSAGNGDLYFWFPYVKGEEALKQGKRGSELFQALQN